MGGTLFRRDYSFSFDPIAAIPGLFLMTQSGVRTQLVKNIALKVYIGLTLFKWFTCQIKQNFANFLHLTSWQS